MKKKDYLLKKVFDSLGVPPELPRGRRNLRKLTINESGKLFDDKKHKAEKKKMLKF